MSRVLVFDSGVGGLSVLKELRAQKCATSYGYLADNGVFPYGLKSDGALIARIPGLIEKAIASYPVDAVVVACNTASTIALSEVRAAVDVPVVGTVPAIKPACRVSHSRVVGLLGTPGTVRRAYTDDLIIKFAGDCEVLRYGAPELAVLAERKLMGEKITADEVRAAVAPLFKGRRGRDIDTVVLACTHFPLLKDELRQVVDRPLQWIDSGAAIARQTKTVLAKAGVKAEGSHQEDLLLLTSDEIAPGLLEAFKAHGFQKAEQLAV